MLIPQAYNVLSFLIAKLWLVPADTEVQLSDPNCTGDNNVVVLFWPVCPPAAAPHVYNLPNTSTPILCKLPPDTLVQLLVPICTGLLLLTLLVTSPN